MRNLLVATALLVGGTALPALADTVQYAATLTPDHEVPPHPGLAGTGRVQATFDTASKTLTYTVTYDGLTGTATMAHFHGAAPVGKNAGVMVPVTGALASPVHGSAVLTAEQTQALQDGQMYFNIHTDANKAGELRGQVEKAM